MIFHVHPLLGIVTFSLSLLVFFFLHLTILEMDLRKLHLEIRTLIVSTYNRLFSKVVRKQSSWY